MGDLVADGKARQRDSFNSYLPERIDAKQLLALCEAHPEIRVVDEYDSLLEELFRIKNPSLRPDNTGYFDKLNEFRAQHYGGQASVEAGNWYYYPWRNAVVHDLPQGIHNLVRTARNRDMITEDEQEKLRGISIGVAGLSVGSNVVLALSLMGQYKELRIADADDLSLSNMNRLQSDLSQLGVPKTTLAARGVYERDPEARVSVFAEGLNERNLNDFLDGLDIVFDEIDDVGTKARIRLAARERRLPVVMMTDCGDSGILDIERYDLDPDQQLFHGRLTQAEIDSVLSGKTDHSGWLQLVAKIIGMEHLPSRLLESFSKIGRQLAGAPQLGTAATVSGGIAAYVARMIALGVPLKTGKIPLIIEANILSGYDQERARRTELLSQMAQKL